MALAQNQNQDNTPAITDALDRALSRDIVKTLNVTKPTSLAEFIELGRVLFRSGIFEDIKTAEGAVGKMILGANMGLDPVQALTGIHVVKGKPQLHYRTLLAKVRMHPDYDYDIPELTNTVATVQFYRHGELKGTSTFTIEDAKRQGTQNIDKYPKNMLLARATSNGIGFYAPDVLYGIAVFSEGEITELTEDEFHEVELTGSPKDQLKAELAAGLQQELPPPPTPNGEPVVTTAQDVAPAEGAPAGDSHTPGVPQDGEGQASVSAADPASTEPPAEAPKDEVVNETPAKSQGAKAPKEETAAKDGAPAADPLEAALEPFDFKASQVRLLKVEAADRGIDLAAALAACTEKTWAGAMAAVTG